MHKNTTATGKSQMFFTQKQKIVTIFTFPVDNFLSIWLNMPYIGKTLTEIMPYLDASESRRLVRADAES